MTLNIAQKSLRIGQFVSFLILIQIHQNMYLEIFKIVCPNIVCITKISKPKRFYLFVNNIYIMGILGKFATKIIHKNLI